MDGHKPLLLCPLSLGDRLGGARVYAVAGPAGSLQGLERPLFFTTLFAFEFAAMFSRRDGNAVWRTAFPALYFLAGIELLDRQLALHRFFHRRFRLGAKLFLGQRDLLFVFHHRS